MLTPKITQIMPAVNWFARYKDENNKVYLLPLVCWALVEYDRGRQKVVGIDNGNATVSGTSFCEDKIGFEGYVQFKK